MNPAPHLYSFCTRNWFTFAQSKPRLITASGVQSELRLSSAEEKYWIHKLLDDSNTSVQRYLDAAHFWTPDAVINRGFDWAKVNQLRVQNEYKWGSGFTNNPPGDVVVSRDSAWYLVGSSYYAQAWSRLVLDFWLNRGLDLSGKYTEYLTASRDPMLRDDYGLNINDDTPLMLIAAHQYYSLSGDRGFLNFAYPSLLRSANYILTQRRVGQNNRHGLVWCDSTETSVRGLCTWRNVISGYNLAGGVTEVNAECYQALLLTAELAKEMGDEPNRARLDAEAKDLRETIEKYLRSSDPSNPFYYLTINPAGKPVADVTADLLFPVLYGVSDASTGRAIMQELFSDHFWAASPMGLPECGQSVPHRRYISQERHRRIMACSEGCGPIWRSGRQGPRARTDCQTWL